LCFDLDGTFTQKRQQIVKLILRKGTVENSFFLTCKGNETVPAAPLLSTYILHSPEFALYHLFLSPKFNFLFHRKKCHETTVERMVSCPCEIQNTQIMDGKI
jgi:hypothetical protein